MYCDGYEAPVHTFGTGAKHVVLLHGWQSNSKRWEIVINALDLNK